MNNTKSKHDLEHLTTYIYKNTGVDSKGLIPQNIPLFLEPDSLIDFDLDAARRYLKRSGLEPNIVNLDLSYVSTYEAYRLTAFMLFDNLKKIAYSKGFLMVSSSPFTRSSFHADEDYQELLKKRINSNK